MKYHRAGILFLSLILGLVWFEFASGQMPMETASPSLGAADETMSAPEGLSKWSDWVLHGFEDQLCPSLYNDPSKTICAWPTRLALNLSPTGGRFRQEWLAETDSWAELPGGDRAWPGSVTVDGVQAPVLRLNGKPRVRILAGSRVIEGHFTWLGSPPETIHIPKAGGLIELTIDDRSIPYPLIDSSGRLWLQKRAKDEGEEERINVRVFRKIVDGIPMTVENLYRLDVSGRAREIKLDGVLLAGAVPMSVSGALPARLTPDGALSLQVRPGRWEVTIRSRLTGPVESIGPIQGFFGQEIWAFTPQNHLRMVKLEGAVSVDPGQTEVPSSWKNQSVYLIDPETVLTFKTLKRGDPNPAPDRLKIHRTWWLDFSGNGFTVNDRITGAVSSGWRLEMNPPGELGRVAIRGADRLITLSGPKDKPGVELRRGKLDMIADSRLLQVKGDLPAVGWDHDFEKASATLNLPPGWRLLTAAGVDEMPGTWFKQWTLLDFFLVLIISIVVFRLIGPGWGVLALATLTLTYHEPGAPKLVWLNLLAAGALIRVLPEGWAMKLAKLWRFGSAVTLIAMAVPFMVGQVRVGLYPQLDSSVLYSQDWRYDNEPGGYANMADQIQAPMEEKAISSLEIRDKPTAQANAPKVQRKLSKKDGSTYYLKRKKAKITQDPNARIQTGPGLPDWKWRSIRMTWNGPVERGQTIKLRFLSPSVNLALSFIRVILLAILIVGLLDLGELRRRFGGRKVAAAAGLAAVLLLSAPSAGIAQDSTGNGWPPKRLLDELQNRLLEKPDCYPACAHYSKMNLTAGPDNIQILLELHAAVKTAVPLPGGVKSWLPAQALINGKPAEGIIRDSEGRLWLLVEKGVHRVFLSGPPQGSTFQIPLPLKPSKVTVQSGIWEVTGLGPGGRVEAGLKLTRKTEAGQSTVKDNIGSGYLPPFFHVKRTLYLGLTWEVETIVQRVTPLGAPLVISVPLLSGESVISGALVENGLVQVNMSAQTGAFGWRSSLNETSLVELIAPKNSPWTETWILDAGPFWHVSLGTEIPVVHHQDAEGRWRPEWRPWPGEKVSFEVTRPEAALGKTLTIDSAALDFTPGERFDKAHLSLNIRASIGGRNIIELPPGAKLQLVKIKGKSQPIGMKDGRVVVPITPGAQQIALEWNQPASKSVFLKGPKVKIGHAAVNARVTFLMPRNRWVIWTGGPRLGPAVLFWTYLVVVVLVALMLGRLGRTPLKTRHWLLLSLGLTQVHPLAAMVIVGWLLVLDRREKMTPPDGWLKFDAMQIGLLAWTATALIVLYTAVEKGLLGIPLMQIKGAGSSDFVLRWTMDRVVDFMPQPWVISLPRLTYHLLMLFWALWLAFSLVGWLRWGWRAFNAGKLWQKPVFKKKTKPAQNFIIE